MSVEYQKEQLLPFPVTHDLNWKGFFFHENTDAHIVLYTVPPENIRFVRQYDVSTFADLYDQAALTEETAKYRRLYANPDC